MNCQVVQHRPMPMRWCSSVRNCLGSLHFVPRRWMMSKAWLLFVNGLTEAEHSSTIASLKFTWWIHWILLAAWGISQAPWIVDSCRAVNTSRQRYFYVQGAAGECCLEFYNVQLAWCVELCCWFWKEQMEKRLGRQRDGTERWRL